MCLQDLQLARAELLEVHNFDPSGAGIFQILPSNPQRTRVVLTGPNQSNLLILINSNSGRGSVGQFFGTTISESRVFDISVWGKLIQGPWWANPAGACSFAISEYSLPVDPESLKRLAATGKW